MNETDLSAHPPRADIAFPFSRLDREPFWELVPQLGTTITPAIINK